MASPYCTTWAVRLFELHSVTRNCGSQSAGGRAVDKICYIGCGVTTGIGAVAFTMNVEAGSTVAVFGLGGIGLNVIQGARLVGATRIIGVDLNRRRQISRVSLV